MRFEPKLGRHLPHVLRIVCGNPPGVSRGVNETTLPFLIRLIFYRGDLRGPKLEGPLENCVDVFNVHVNRASPWFDVWRKIACLDNQGRVSDLHLDMKAPRTELEAFDFSRVERLADELREIDRAVHIRANRSTAVADVCCGLIHVRLVS
jgi:hypothetical protein